MKRVHQPECECATCGMGRDLVQLTSEPRLIRPQLFHDETCVCDACETDRLFNRMMTEGMPESPSVASRVFGAIKETLIWAAVVGFVVLMVRCGSPAEPVTPKPLIASGAP